MLNTSRRNLAIRIVAVAAAAIFAGATLSVVGPADTSEAAEAKNFQAGNIISDETFFNSAAMSTAQVQSFLNSQVITCKATTGPTCLKSYTENTTTRAATSYCGEYTGRTNESAASIIQRVGAACGINPQVLIVLLQKEQGLITETSPTTRQYQAAMGYACPDTAPCDTKYYGFYNQVFNSAQQFQRYTKTSSQWTYRPGRWNNIQWNPNVSCGAAPVFIENQATANLYIYTPYQPNAAALANLTGIGDSCSAYGNRNFWRLFTDWFGNPTNWIQSASFEGGSTSGWGSSNGGINMAVYQNPSVAQNGNWHFASNTPVAGRSFSQDIARPTNVGEQAEATIWLRSSSSTPIKGRVALWGLDGKLENATQQFTVAGAWQQITVQLPVAKSNHNLIRLDVYMDTPNETIFADNASISFGKAPIPKNMMVEPSFEGSFDGWVHGNGFVNQQVYRDPAGAQNGEWYAATNTPVSGRSLAQDVRVEPLPHDRYTASIRVKAADPSKRSTGTLALWGMGKSGNHLAKTTFAATGAWQEVSVTFSAGTAPISTLRVELYMADTGTTFLLDNSQLSRNLLTAGSFEGNLFTGWGAGNGTVEHAVYRSSGAATAIEGEYFAATNTRTNNSSLAQVVERKPKVGETYTAEVWLRSSTTTPFTGSLALWALGGTTEVASVPFTVGSTWTKVQVRLPISQAGHTSFKFEIYENSTNATLWVDAAQLY